MLKTKLTLSLFAAGAMLMVSLPGWAESPTQNMFGGPIYDGAPALAVTAALVKAGGGAKHFSTARALTSMLGAKTVNAEVAKLTRQYGKKRVQEWLTGHDYVIKDALMHATAAGVKLPKAPADLHGKKLAETLVSAGTADDGTFWSGLLYDKAVSHDIHNQLMMDVNAKYGVAYDQNVHRLTNQAFYDVA